MGRSILPRRRETDPPREIPEGLREVYGRCEGHSTAVKKDINTGGRKDDKGFNRQH